MWGNNQLNERLWHARQIEGHEEWEGTGRNHASFITFVDFKAALSSFLVYYPDTDTIQAVLDNQYRIAFPNRAPAITILDAIAKELGYDE